MTVTQETLSTQTWEAIKAAKKVFSHNKTLTLVTHADGNVWAAKVYFAEEDGYLYGVLEQPVGSRGHNLQNVLRNPNVFFVIEHGVSEPFIQGEGKMEILGDVSERPERHVLFRKVLEAVPFANSFPLVVFRLQPTVLHISDYSEQWKERTSLQMTDEVLKVFQTRLKTHYSAMDVYLKAIRYFSFTVPIFPILLGALAAPTISWWLLLLSLIGGVLINAGVNVLSDYGDYRRGADTWTTLGSSRVLVDGLLSSRRMMQLGFILLAAGIVVGLFIAGLRGIPVLYIGLAGCFLGVFYTLPPIGLKYMALGDLAIFLTFVPLAGLGSYYVQAQSISWTPVLLSVPAGLLAVAILNANNMRDMKADIKSGYRTVAGFLGSGRAPVYYGGLIFGAYVVTVAEIVAGTLPLWALVPLITLGMAMNNVRAAFQPQRVLFTFLDLSTAKLHLTFGVLLVAGVAAGKWLT